MVLMAHRRIRMLAKVVEDVVEEDVKVEVEEMTEEEVEARASLASAKKQEQEKLEPLMLGETENVEQKEFTTTEDVKAMTQEVIKTIRDIIALNPLYR